MLGTQLSCILALFSTAHFLYKNMFLWPERYNLLWRAASMSQAVQGVSSYFPAKYVFCMTAWINYLSLWCCSPLHCNWTEGGLSIGWWIAGHGSRGCHSSVAYARLAVLEWPAVLGAGPNQGTPITTWPICSILCPCMNLIFASL